MQPSIQSEEDNVDVYTVSSDSIIKQAPWAKRLTSVFILKQIGILVLFPQ